MGWGGYRNEPAVRPADSAGRTSARRFGRPAGRTAGTYQAGRPAEPPPGGFGQIFGQNPPRRSRPADFGRPDRRQAVRPAESAGRTAAEFFGRGPPPSPTAVSFR